MVSERLAAAEDWCVGGEDWLQRDMRTLLKVMEILYIMIVLVVPSLYAFVKLIRLYS